MKVIALAGLVSIEKIQLTIDLATYYTWQTQQSVTIVDNIARLAIDPVQLSDETLIRITGDITDTLADVLRDIDSDIVILAISESAELDNLFITLDIVSENLPIELISIGLVDLRTCDCFPHLREKIEDYANVHLLAPFNVDDVVALIEGSAG